MADNFLNPASVNVPSTCSSVTATNALTLWTNSFPSVSSNRNVHNYGTQNIMWQPGSSGTPGYLLQNPQPQSSYTYVWSMHGGSSQATTVGRVATAQPLQTAFVSTAQLPQCTSVQSRADIHIRTMARQNEHLQQSAAIPIIGMQTQSSNYYYTSVPGQYPVDNSALYISNQLHPMQMARTQIVSLSQTSTVLPTISSVGSSMLQHPVQQKDILFLLKEIQPGQCARTSGYMLPPSAVQQIQMIEHPNTIGIQQPTQSGVGTAQPMTSNPSTVTLSNLSQPLSAIQWRGEVMNTPSHIPGQIQEVVSSNNQITQLMSKNTEKISHVKGTKVPQSVPKHPLVSRKERKKELLLGVKDRAAYAAALKIKAKAKTKKSKSSTIDKSGALSKITQLAGNLEKTSKQLKTASHPGDHISKKTSKHSGQKIKNSIDTKLSADAKSNLETKKPKMKVIENKLSINSKQSEKTTKSKTRMPSFKDTLAGDTDKNSKGLKSKSAVQSNKDTEVPNTASRVLGKRKKPSKPINPEMSKPHHSHLSLQMHDSIQVFHPLGKKAAPSAPNALEGKRDNITSNTRPSQVKQSLDPASHKHASCPDLAKQRHFKPPGSCSRFGNKGINSKSHLSGLKLDANTTLINNSKEIHQERKSTIRPPVNINQQKQPVNVQHPITSQEKSYKMWGTSNIAGNTNVSTSSTYQKSLQQLEVSIPIPPEKRAERESMKRKAQLEREEAAKYTSKGRLQFSFDTQEQHEIAYRFGYPF